MTVKLVGKTKRGEVYAVGEELNCIVRIERYDGLAGEIVLFEIHNLESGNHVTLDEDQAEGVLKILRNWFEGGGNNDKQDKHR